MKFILMFLVLLSITGNALSAEDAPGWHVNGSYRLRYEHLSNSFRPNVTGDDELLPARLLLSLKAVGKRLYGEIELEDSRAWLDDSDTPLGTDDVNTAEPLQAYLGWRQPLSNESKLLVRAGRFTMDIGSRRFVARNRFRNTLNAYTGIHTTLDRPNGSFTFFYTLPVQREPTDRIALDDNRQDIDETYPDIRFWGLHGSYQVSGSPLRTEWFVFGLQEDDQPELATSNRDIVTLGGRILKTSRINHWDYELEAAYQSGESHASKAATDTVNLDHRASFVHAHIGYQFDDRWSSRIVLQADYASGDKNPNDNENNRFDTLFGARRFEFGPTGIYGAFARSNILSPGLRWEFKRDKHSGFVGYRAVWLAEKRDALTTAGVRDATGGTDSFVGRQLEARYRHPIGSKLQIELGAAYLAKGDFLKEAPNAGNTDNTLYWYSQITYRL